jgi:RNA polymerase sigma factor (sigma-70 family)
MTEDTLVVVNDLGASPAELFRRYGPELMRFATGLVGRQDAEDVFSQALTKALAAPRFSSVANPRAYLYRAVFNEANTWRRRLSMRGSVEARAALAGYHEDTLPRLDVIEAVLELSTRQRAAVLLTYWADLSPAGVADRLGTSEGSVRRHLARARAHLRRILDE